MTLSAFLSGGYGLSPLIRCDFDHAFLKVIYFRDGRVALVQFLHIQVQFIDLPVLEISLEVAFDRLKRLHEVAPCRYLLQRKLAEGDSKFGLHELMEISVDGGTTNRESCPSLSELLR